MQTQCSVPQQATPQLKTQFEINDLADTDRILLTSKSIQNDIEEFSGNFFICVTKSNIHIPFIILHSIKIYILFSFIAKNNFFYKKVHFRL